MQPFGLTHITNGKGFNIGDPFPVVAGGSAIAKDHPEVVVLPDLGGGPPTLTLVCLDGTSIKGQPFFFDDTLGAWVPFGAVSAAVTPAAPVQIAVPRMRAASVVVQWSTNVGNVTKAGWLYLA